MLCGDHLSAWSPVAHSVSIIHRHSHLVSSLLSVSFLSSFISATCFQCYPHQANQVSSTHPDSLIMCLFFFFFVEAVSCSPVAFFLLCFFLVLRACHFYSTAPLPFPVTVFPVTRFRPKSVLFSCYPFLLLSFRAPRRIATKLWPCNSLRCYRNHYNDVIMGVMASQITNLPIGYSTVYLVADQRKHQSSASLAFVRGIHRSQVNSPHKRPVMRKMFPFDDVIMMAANVRPWLLCWRSDATHKGATMCPPALWHCHLATGPALRHKLVVLPRKWGWGEIIWYRLV